METNNGSSQYEIRRYVPERDRAMVNHWAITHGKEGGLPADFLPPDGIIAMKGEEPIAAAWLYKSLGVGVAFMEHVHTKPGTSVAEAKKVILEMVEFFRFDAREDGYGVIVCHTTPSIARFARKNGWTEINDSLVQMLTPTGLAERKEVAA